MKDNPVYVIFLQCTYCVQKSLTVSCTLLCECGDKVKVDQSSFSAYLHAVMLRHHCSEYGQSANKKAANDGRPKLKISDVGRFFNVNTENAIKNFEGVAGGA